MTANDRAATESKKKRVPVTPSLIEAAKLRIVLNDRQGLPTEPWLRELAERVSDISPTP